MNHKSEHWKTAGKWTLHVKLLADWIQRHACWLTNRPTIHWKIEWENGNLLSELFWSVQSSYSTGNREKRVNGMMIRRVSQSQPSHRSFVDIDTLHQPVSDALAVSDEIIPANHHQITSKRWSVKFSSIKPSGRRCGGRRRFWSKFALSRNLFCKKQEPESFRSLVENSPHIVFKSNFQTETSHMTICHCSSHSPDLHVTLSQLPPEEIANCTA